MNIEIADNSRRNFLATLTTLPLIPAAALLGRHAAAGGDVLPNDFPIAGYQYHQGPHVHELLQPGDALQLRPEPDNPHDPFAVGIFHGDDQLGYVPRACNRPVSRLLQEGVQLACVIQRVNAPRPAWEAVHVRIHLPIKP